MTLTRTHTQTHTLLNAWASTLPWDCLVRATDCRHPTHEHHPMVGDLCAVETCRKPLHDREECYGVTEQDGWVCWRHVRPDTGPIGLT